MADDVAPVSRIGTKREARSNVTAIILSLNHYDADSSDEAHRASLRPWGYIRGYSRRPDAPSSGRQAE